MRRRHGDSAPTTRFVRDTVAAQIRSARRLRILPRQPRRPHASIGASRTARPGTAHAAARQRRCVPALCAASCVARCVAARTHVAAAALPPRALPRVRPLCRTHRPRTRRRVGRAAAVEPLGVALRTRSRLGSVRADPLPLARAGAWVRVCVGVSVPLGAQHSATSADACPHLRQASAHPCRHLDPRPPSSARRWVAAHPCSQLRQGWGRARVRVDLFLCVCVHVRTHE
jgi:hypothetical protein